MILPDDADVYAAALEAVDDDLVMAAREAGWPIPMRTVQWIESPLVVRRVSLLVLGCAWLRNDPEQLWRARLRDASTEAHAALAGDRGVRRFTAQHMTPEDVARARFPPDGDRAQWVRWGRWGPPAEGATS